MMKLEDFILNMKQGKRVSVQTDIGKKVTYYAKEIDHNPGSYGLYKDINIIGMKPQKNMVDGIITKDIVGVQEEKDFEKLISDYVERLRDKHILLVCMVRRNELNYDDYSR